VNDRPSGELDKSPTEAPRMAPNPDRPGEYRIAIRIVDGEIDPGDKLRLEIYILGYGKIRGSKVSFRPPPYFIDPEGSKGVFALREEEDRLLWGGQEQMMGPEGFTFLMSGIRGEGWDDATPYIDVYPPEEADKGPSPPAGPLVSCNLALGSSSRVVAWGLPRCMGSPFHEVSNLP
jgi:hypothetical protein